MPPPVVSEAVRRKFTGNIVFYREQYRYRQRVFLPRNINAVLNWNGTAHDRSFDDDQEAGPASRLRSRTAPEKRQPRGEQIAEIYNRLQPFRANSKDEGRLKINIVGIKRTPTGHRSNGAWSTPSSGVSFRCRVKLRVWNLHDGEVPPDADPLHCETEMCTVTYDSDNSATVDMDDWFVLGVSKLRTIIRCDDKTDFRVADGYCYELALTSVDASVTWPPFHTGVLSSRRDASGLEVVIRMNIKGLIVPSTCQLKAFLRPEPAKHNFQLSVLVECGWRNPWKRLLLRQNPQRLATPSLEGKDHEATFDFNASVLTCYTFIADVKHGRGVFGAPDSKGQQVFTVPGYACCMCDGRQFRDVKYLHFHFITAHALFHFRVVSRKPQPGLRNGRQYADLYIQVVVDLAKETTHSRASDHTPDPRIMAWVRPTRQFDINKILKGDWTWLNEKKGGATGSNRQDSGPVSPEPMVMKRNFDWNDIRDVTQRGKKRFLVKKPRHTEKGLVYIRTASKRYVEVGEMLSDSDDDVDEEWLFRKHDETICDFEDISAIEHEFMKLWDMHMFEERIPSMSHLGPSVYRFAKKNKEVLCGGPLLIEFWKHCLNQIQHRTIDAECLRMVMVAVKGGKDKWSSVGETKCGIGLKGEYIADGLDPLPSTPPVANRRRPRILRRPGRPARGDPTDAGEESPPTSQPNQAQKGKEPAVNEPVAKATPAFGICTCRGPWDRTQMVLCRGKKCPTRWFHRSCYGVERWCLNWTCPNCFVAVVKQKGQLD